MILKKKFGSVSEGPEDTMSKCSDETKQTCVFCYFMQITLETLVLC